MEEELPGKETVIQTPTDHEITRSGSEVADNDQTNSEKKEASIELAEQSEAITNDKNRYEQSLPIIPHQQPIRPLKPDMEDPGSAFSGNLFGGILMIILFLFYGNVFMALIFLICGPALIFPEMDDTGLDFLFGLGEVGGAYAMVYYLILTMVITLSFLKALKEDGREYIGLVAKELKGWFSGITGEENRPPENEIERYGPGEMATASDHIHPPNAISDRTHPTTSSIPPHPSPPMAGVGSMKADAPSMFSPYLNNTFVLVAFFFFAVYAFEFVFDLFIVDLFGFERHFPRELYDIPTWEHLYSLPEAPVMEELADRVLFIGIPLYFIHHWGIRKRAKHRAVKAESRDGWSPLLDARGQYVQGSPEVNEEPDVDGLFKTIISLFQRKNWKYILGGGFQIDTRTFMVLLVSSFIFALGHIGWDWTKLFPTFLGGIMLGMLFLKKGVHACIMLHFAINSFGIPYEVLGEPMSMEIVLMTIFLGSIPFGLYYLYHYLQYFVRLMARLELNTRSKEFARAMTVSGGVFLFVFCIISLVYTGISLTESETVTTDEHLYFEFSDGDYQIIELGEFSNIDSFNGTIDLEGDVYDVEIILVNESMKNYVLPFSNVIIFEYHDNEDIIYYNRFNFVDIQSESPMFTFNLSFEQNEKVFLIIHTRESSIFTVSYTTVDDRSDEEGSGAEAVTCGVMTILFAMLALGCIYTSNYYRYGGWDSADLKNRGYDGYGTYPPIQSGYGPYNVNVPWGPPIPPSYPPQTGQPHQPGPGGGHMPPVGPMGYPPQQPPAMGYYYPPSGHPSPGYHQPIPPQQFPPGPGYQHPPMPMYPYPAPPPSNYPQQQTQQYPPYSGQQYPPQQRQPHPPQQMGHYPPGSPQQRQQPTGYQHPMPPDQQYQNVPPGSQQQQPPNVPHQNHPSGMGPSPHYPSHDDHGIPVPSGFTPVRPAEEVQRRPYPDQRMNPSANQGSPSGTPRKNEIRWKYNIPSHYVDRNETFLDEDYDDEVGDKENEKEVEQ